MRFANSLSALRHGLLEVLDGLLQLPPFLGGQTEVVVAVGVVLVAVDKEPREGLQPVQIALGVRLGHQLDDLGRVVGGQDAVAPEELVVAVPLVGLLLADLQAPRDQVAQVLQLQTVATDHLGGRVHTLRVRHAELACEGTEIVSKAAQDLARLVRIAVGQRVHALLDASSDLVPVEADPGIALLEHVIETPTALWRIHQGPRLGLRAEREQHLLPDLAGVGIACALDDGELVAVVADVGHGGLRDSRGPGVARRAMLCKPMMLFTTTLGCRRPLDVGGSRVRPRWLLSCLQLLEAREARLEAIRGARIQGEFGARAGRQAWPRSGDRRARQTAPEGKSPPTDAGQRRPWDAVPGSDGTQRCQEVLVAADDPRAPTGNGAGNELVVIRIAAHGLGQGGCADHGGLPDDEGQDGSHVNPRVPGVEPIPDGGVLLEDLGGHEEIQPPVPPALQDP